MFAVVVRVDFSPSVTSCHLPRQMEAFFGGSKPTALLLSYIACGSYIGFASYICLTASDIALFVRSCGYLKINLKK